MEVKLLTPEGFLKVMEDIAAIAYLTCHANVDKEYVPHEKLERAIKAGHESVLEHITLTYSVKGLSRACLQELARHRLISLSVESTRHTLKKNVLADMEKELTLYAPMDIAFPDSSCHVNNKECSTLGEFLVVLIRDIVENHPDMPNDGLKYFIPEFWPTNLILTSNIRELRHIIKLRTNPAALNEFRVLAYSLFEAVPESFKYLLEDCVYREKSDYDAQKGGEA